MYKCENKHCNWAGQETETIIDFGDRHCPKCGYFVARQLISHNNTQKEKKYNGNNKI